ncbi:diacylglycerol kinase catalytic region [Calothrix parasitica NIES-267]|uniref:Diacylglycerol kinase catalytic region n=1 Tax=Calothrix parasitica NIES-267 TaxID=1973488 RepID=A0A1Z4LVK0_9CYAN|nr:diacylglycerol kinase catalytic region [Calothrix parasitica NIES-267]
MTRSACLIFNPVAGQGDSEADLKQIRSLLEPDIQLDIQFTTEEVDAGQLALQAVDNGVESIIASGGDGTLSAAAEALVETNIPLGIISRGTANAFAAALGIPDTIEAACQNILAGNTRVVDSARCNGKPMILLAGIGFEAETVENADREAKNRYGMLAYFISGLQQLRDFANCEFEAKIETDNQMITVTAAALTIANAAPPTSILAQGPAGIIADDGLLDLTIVAPENRMGAIASAYHLLQTAFRDEATKRDDIGYLQSKRLQVETSPPQKVVMDGEIIGTTPIEIECIPSSLTIFVPVNSFKEPSDKLEGLPGLKIEDRPESE